MTQHVRPRPPLARRFNNQRHRRSFLLLGVALAFGLASCSSEGESAVEPTDSNVAVGTVAKRAGGEEVSPPTADQQSSSADSGVDSGIGRTAGEPGPDGPALLHILGSIRSVSDPTTIIADAAEPIRNDLATIAFVGCAPSTCPVELLAPWASGQIEVLNIATRQAASEGGGQLAAYFDDFSAQGVATIGYGNNIEAAVEPIVVRSNDERVAIHSISLDPDNPALATNDSPGIAGVTALDALRQQVIANRNNGFGVVVLVDWGDNDFRSPSAEQIADVELLIEAGADAIVGHGSSFLQRFDLVGQTTVAYSLGNSSISTTDPLRADTAILRLEFDTPGRSCLLPATGEPSGPTLDDPATTTC